MKRPYQKPPPRSSRNPICHHGTDCQRGRALKPQPGSSSRGLGCRCVLRHVNGMPVTLGLKMHGPMKDEGVFPDSRAQVP